MNRVLAVVLAVCICAMAGGQGVMSPALRSEIKRVAPERTVEAVVSADAQAIEALRRCGLTVDMQVGNTVLVRGSHNALQQASNLKGVNSMLAPRRVKLMSDATRNYCHVSEVLQGIDMVRPYTGKGVVVGVIDCGIEYNHMAFIDSTGQSRVSRVYDPADSTSTVTVDGVAQRGAEYVTPQAIAALTTDDTGQTHGTHTSGIAVGSKVGKYGGMAPEAEIVMAGIGIDDLTDYNVMLAMRYIAAYAASVGRPCVINMSLGTHEGPHDGTGPFSQLIAELNNRYGTIFVMSAGNEGDLPLYLHKTMTHDDTSLSTVMYRVGANDAIVEAWSHSNSPLSISYSVYDNSMGNIVATTQPFATDTVLNLDAVDELKNYYKGQIEITQGIAVNGHYSIRIEHSAMQRASQYYLAFTIHGNAGDEVDVWDIDQTAKFNRCNLAGYQSGTTHCSYNDMSTGLQCISVGASVGRDTYPTNKGTYYNGYNLGDVASFTSYGTEPSGIVHPFVLAPGVTVVSSMSNYCCNKSTYVQRQSTPSGTYDYWHTMSGTSMSAPTVSGIVALWLQACPTLTIEQIRETIVATSALITDGNPKRGENGEINAMAGLQHILGHYAMSPGDVNGDGQVDIADVNIIINIMLVRDDASNYAGRADVNGDNTVDIGDVNTLLNLMIK